MVAVIVKNALYRVFLPACLLFAALIRPSILSAIYALLALSNPLFPRIRTSFPLSTATKIFLILTVVTALLTSVFQLIYQVVEHVSVLDDAGYVKDCELGKETWRYWLRQAGFTRVPESSVWGFRFMLPEVVALLSSLATLLVCVTKHGTADLNEPARPVNSGYSQVSNTGRSVHSHGPYRLSDAIKPSLQRLSDLLLTFFTVFIGVIQPCLLNSVYFIIFLVLMTWYSLYIPLERNKFNGMKRFLIGYSGLHLLVLYFYNIDFIKNYLHPDSFVARLIGLTDLTSPVNCVKWWDLSFNTYWTAYVNFFGLWVYYFYIVSQYKWTRTGIRNIAETIEDDASSDHEELLSADVEQGPNSIPLQRITSAVLDRQKISVIFRKPGEKETTATEGLTALTFFCLHHFYVFGLVAMMTWALLYHSLFGLIFLFAACVLWALRDSRKWCFRIAPIVLIYAEFLLVVQYIYSLDLIAQKEIFVSSVFEIIGFQLASSRSAAFLTLVVKVILSLPFFVLLRLKLRENYYDSLSDHDKRKRLYYGTFSTSERVTGRRLTNISADTQTSSVIFNALSKFLTKYWIFVVSFVLLVNALSSPPVDYTAGYLILWCLLIVLLHSFRIFRRLIFLYWTLLIVYSSIVLLTVYTYQFPSVPEFWQRELNLSAETFAEIGLVDYRDERNSSLLFLRLLLPILVVLVTMLQLKFFHDPWTKLVQTPNHAEVDSNTQTTDERTSSKSVFKQIKHLCRQFAEVLWRLAEVHLPKLVLLILIITAASHLCVLNFVLVLFVPLALCLPALTTLISLLLTVYLALATVARIVFLIHGKSTNETDFNVGDGDCPDLGLNGTAPQSFSDWLGLGYISSAFERDVVGLVLLLVTIAIQLSVKYRQKHHRRLRGEPEPPSDIIFVGEDGQYVDKSMLHCIRFMFNYFFYKFGLEVSMVMMAIVAWVRMDTIGLIVVTWLFVFACIPRRFARALWPIFLLFLAVLMPLQYAMWIGLPQELCISYPWSYWIYPDPNTTDGTKLNENLLRFLDLANYRVSIDTAMAKSYLVADFFLILFVAAQEKVFRKENSSHVAGDNYSIYSSGDYTLRKNNPHYDFIMEQRTFVDYFKIIVFMYGHWFTLIMVLSAGLGGTSLFALGYLVLAFWLLWQGNNLYTIKNYRRTLARWNFLLAYTVAVIFFKVATQALGCVFISHLSSEMGCVLRQLFSIICVNTASFNNLVSLVDDTKATCNVENAEAKIGYDLFALLFLVFQLRILHSWYFQQCIIDFRCEIVQSSRGALLINQLIEKEMKEQNIQQQAKFDEIRKRTAAIRKQYEEQQRRGNIVSFDAQTYAQERTVVDRPLSIIDVDDPFPAYDPRVADDVVLAKRAGDYYMFNYEPGSDELVAPVESFVPEVTPGAGDFDKLDPAQILHTAISKDMDLQGTLNAVETAEKIKDEEQRMIQAVSDPNTTEVNAADASSQTEVTKEESDTVTNILKFIAKICKSGLEWFTAFMNRRSREHRYVAYVLSKEKMRLKNEMNHELYDETISMKEFRENWEGRSMNLISSESDIERLEDEALSHGLERHFLARLILAVGFCICAHTDLIAYIFASIAHARCAGLITLPIPALVFFWGTLASPRPSKNFWITLIAYTELEIFIKFILQFGFYPWNKTPPADDGQTLVDIFGVQKESYFAFWDVALLIALFFHRYMLRRLGLWKDANTMDTFIDAPSENSARIEDIELRTDADQVVEIPTEERGVISSFIFKLFHPKFRYIRDLYPLMFFSDVACFFIVVFGYSSFGDGGSGSVLTDISSNRVPITFVVLLFVISLMIVIDRGLYLRKATFCKLIYQLAVVIAIHVWIFFLLPLITKTKAASNTIAQILYVVKCIYFIISAWQIRNGYPQLCIGNLLTHSYGLVNMVLFKIFMIIPFLFELRTAIDWTWTDTSMPILDFFSMENFYSTIYNLKCARSFEQAFPAPRGVAKGTIVKYSIGIPLILAIILIIWFPLLIYALLNQIGTFLPPDKVQLTLNLEGYPPLFTMEAQGYEVMQFSSETKNLLTKIITESLNTPNIYEGDRNDISKKVRRAASFVQDYAPGDIYRVKFRPVSEVTWAISNDSRTALIFQLSDSAKNGSSISIRLSANLMVQRERDGAKEPITQTTSFAIELSPNGTPDIWHGLSRVLNISAGSTSEAVDIENILPFFINVPTEGEVKAADLLLEAVLRRPEQNAPFPDLKKTYSTLSLRLQRENDVKDSMVWKTQAKSNSYLKSYHAMMGSDPVKYPTANNDSYIDIVMFVDRVIPDVLLKYASGGIFAMYLALVVVVGRVIRGVIASQPLDVIINEIPNPDHLLKICLDIYLVREAKDFILEQDMYAKLIFLFRSPATLIKWTRYKPKQE